MPRETHEQWELDATAGKTLMRHARVVQSFTISQTSLLTMDWDGSGQPDEDAWQEEAKLDAITANDIQCALRAIYPNRKFDVELIETEEIDV